jgi:acyl-CoA thioesterase YciA
MPMNETPPPLENLVLRMFAVPQDANLYGDIFGGWIVSQMDIAGWSVAINTAKERATTIAIDNLNFLYPVVVGDEVSYYAEIVKIGYTSIRVKVEVWAKNLIKNKEKKVTEGVFTYVAIDDNKKPTPIKKS